MQYTLRSAFIVLFFSFTLLGCTTFSNTIFLIHGVDDQAKSRILTETGRALYEREVVTRENYEAIPQVQKYFVVALRYDPGNSWARENLERMEKYKETILKEKMVKFQGLLNTSDRTEEEDYMFCLFAQQCIYIDPKNPETQQLKDVTSETRSALLKTYRERTEVALAETEDYPVGEPRDYPAGYPGNPLRDYREFFEKKESLYIDALKNINKTLSIDPGNWYAALKKKTVSEEVGKIFNARAADVEKMIDETQYEEAEKGLLALSDINTMLDYSYDKELSDLQYRLNYRWAQSFYKEKQFPLAEEKINRAIMSESTNEALSLRNQIESDQAELSNKTKTRVGKSGREPSGAKAIKEIEELIKSGDLATANKLIISRLAKEKDSATIQRLQELADTIREWLKWYYDLALTYYRQENFMRAVQLFTLVVEIDEYYEMASDYLDKAKSKQKLIESLGMNS